MWAEPRKNSEIRNDAPSSRQPLVKGERLVRSELGAAMSCPVRVGSVPMPFSRDAGFVLSDATMSRTFGMEIVEDSINHPYPDLNASKKACMRISQNVYLEPKWLRCSRIPVDIGNTSSGPTETEKASSTQGCSRTVPQFSTDRALRRLTAEFERDPVYSARYGRWRLPPMAVSNIEKCGP